MSITETHNKFSFFGICIMLFIITACKSAITIDDVNKPTLNHFKAALKEYSKRDQDYDLYVQSLKYEYDARLTSRNKVIDSLKLLDKKPFVIIDCFTSGYNGIFEENYFFYNDECLLMSRYGKTNSLTERDNGIIQLYEHFKSGNVGGSKKDIDFDVNGICYVTVVNGNKVKYYKVNSPIVKLLD